MSDLLLKISEAITAGDEQKVQESVGRGLNEGISPRDVLEKGMVPAMNDIGARFSKGEAYIPELIVAAVAMEAGMEVLKPRLGGDSGDAGLVVLGTVQGDIHSIGKNLVKICLEGAGMEVVDIGEDVKTERFLEAYLQDKPDILGLSALLSSTMQRMQEVIEAIRVEDPGARIMVGGAPITKDFADEIGASGYAPNAFEAAVKARELIKEA